MQRLYRLEVFDRNYNFCDFCPIEPQPVTLDYLTLDRTTIITTRAMDITKGDYVTILDGGGQTVHQGIVDNVETVDAGHSITIKPLLSIFDTQLHFDRDQLTAVEDFIAGIITDNYLSSLDMLQNITGLTVVAMTHTTGRLNLKDNIHNLYEIIIKALTTHNVTVDVTLLPQQKQLRVVLEHRQPIPVIIEADLPCITDKTFTIGNSYGQVNKLIIVNKADETKQATYYLHSDGRVSDININRMAPVFLAAEYYEGENLAIDAPTRAREALTPQNYNNLIEITCLNDNHLISTKMAIGTIADIYHDGKVYRSLLTGFERYPDYTRLVFGAVRVDLTKQLTIERRRQQ